MKIRLNPFAAVLCSLGMVIVPALSLAVESNGDAQQIEKLTSQTQSLKLALADLQSEVDYLKKQKNSASTNTKPHAVHHRHHVKTRANQPAQSQSQSDANAPAKKMSESDVQQNAAEQQSYLPFDLDVPGQAFVSTGPYVGVPIQYSGSDLVINSPSVNTDTQLLGIRKSIIEHLNAMGGEIVKEPYHSHLLLSGVVEGQANYSNIGGQPSTTDIDVTNVSLDAFFLGPSDWTLGFIEFSYDNDTPANSVFSSTSSYRVSNARVFVNKAFVTIGDFEKSPFYGSFGQFYVPFGVYSSLMVSTPLTTALARTKARAILLGFQQQGTDSFYGSTYMFRGDSHANSVSKVNNAGINLGYKFEYGKFGANMGAGVIANLADSGGMQSFSGGFSSNEQLVHTVPAYNLHGLFSFGTHIDVIAEYVGASKSFNPNDLSFNGHGARPWALDTEATYSFYILDNRPSSVGLGYAKTNQALALGLPLSRYSLVFNTSLWRNTLQSLEFRTDREYAASSTATGAGNSVSTPETGKMNKAVTAQFDYYF